LGIKGIFYRIAGREAASIDGPTSYSLYPSNFSAKLGPKDPEKVAKEIAKNINLSLVSFNQELTSQFLGVAIIDANDLGQNVLGNASKLSNQLIEKIFSDNPMGQSDEQTPLVLVVIGDK
jgi:asparagine synthase (glutamine-hydrolysing)